MTQPTTKPTIYLDASALKESSCKRLLLYRIFYGFSTKASHHNFKMGYGSAVHRALEYWYGLPLDKRTKEAEQTALEKASNYYEPFSPYIGQDYRTPQHLLETLKAYFTYYPPEFDDWQPIGNLLESKWIYPIVTNEHFDIVLCGTIDSFISYQGEECFGDHKSTAFKGDNFFGQYQLDVQMLLYSWYIERMIGRRLPCVINGIFLKTWTKKAREDKKPYFDGVSFERSQKITYDDATMRWFDSWLMEQINWLEYYLNRISIEESMPSYRFKPATLTQSFANLSFCNNSKWGCGYFSICSQRPEFQDRLLSGLEIEKYEPLRFSE